MTTISATVMAHPKRKARAEELLRELEQYPFVDPSITWDEQNDEWHTGERALKQGIGKAEWHVVIQDDAILSPGFYDNLQGALAAAPKRTLISLYTGTARPLGQRVKIAVDKARIANASWLSHYLLFWGVGICIPSAHIEHALEFVEGRTEDYDVRLGIFYQRNMLPVYYTQPSLVDHDDAVGSLLGHGEGSQPRVAHELAVGPVIWNSQPVAI